jgi:hypothetical protein
MIMVGKASPDEYAQEIGFLSHTRAPTPFTGRIFLPLNSPNRFPLGADRTKSLVPAGTAYAPAFNDHGNERTSLMKNLLLAMTATTCLAGAAAADTITIYTGGAPTGAGSTYHEGIGQGVADFLKDIADDYGYEIKLVPTGGAVDNAKRLAAHEGGLAFGIGQGGLTYAEVEAGKASILRKDLPGECAMAFTKEPRISSWGDIVTNADRVTWVVPENSGSEAFVNQLYTDDSNFEGKTPNFVNVAGSDNIVATVGSPTNRGAVGFFFAYPNPVKGLVNAAAGADMKIFGVLSPDIARGDDAYYLNRKAPYEMSWMGFGETKTTRAMCAKALLMASDPDNIDDPWAREDADVFLAAIEAAPAEAFVPSNGPLAKVMGQIEAMSEELGVSDMVSDLESQIKGR